jgi:hypothetical protein
MDGAAETPTAFNPANTEAPAPSAAALFNRSRRETLLVAAARINSPICALGAE